MIYKKYTIILFCIHETGMAFETPLAPGGLHFYSGPSGVKLILGDNDLNTVQSFKYGR